MKVTVLVENSLGACPSVTPEFGLSLLIQGTFGTVLLDTGSTGLLARNADALGFHLGLPRSERLAVTPDEARALARELRDMVTGEIHAGHCTGTEAFGVLATEMGPKLRALSTGLRFET